MIKNAKNDFKKDSFKLMNDAVFGKLWKLWENIQESSLQQPIQERIIYYMSQTIVQQKLFWDIFISIKNERTQIFVNKPVYLGLSKLEKANW